MKNERPRVGIFIPCYNEAEIIDKTIKTVKNYINSEHFPYNGVIIYLDDGSRDKSYDLAMKAGADCLYRHKINLGLGTATRAGLEIAHFIGCDAVAKFDADLQHEVQDIYPAVKLIIEDKADIVYASRFKGTIHYKMPFLRRIGNPLFTFFMKCITGWHITDAQTGLMCFGRRYLSVFEIPGAYNPPQQALFDGYIKGMRYAETSAQFYKRQTGSSFVSFKYIYNVLSSLAKVSFLMYSYAIFSILSFTLLIIGLFMGIKAFRAVYAYGMQTDNLVYIVLTLFSLGLGFASFLFGLLSHTITERTTHIRNDHDYRYIVTENVVIQSPGKVDTSLRGPEILKNGSNL